MSDYTIGAGSTTPALNATLGYDDGTPADLAGASGVINIRNPDATAVYLTAACTVTSATTVQYQWQPGDTNVPGDYLVDFLITFATGQTQTFPNEGYNTLTITPSLVGTGKARPQYLTTADLITQTRVYLDGRLRPGRNKLGNEMDTATTAVSLMYTTSGVADAVPISIGLETMWVWSVAGSTLTVERGADGTLPSQHAAGDMILVDPEFTDAKILQAINLELAALPSAGVWQPKSLDRFMTANTDGYDLSGDVVEVLDVRWQDLCDTTQWTPLASWEVSYDMPTSSFPSGVALFLPERPVRFYGVTNATAIAMRVGYRADFGTLTSLFDDVLTVTGIGSSAVDILPIGAAIRLMAGRPIQRVSTNAQPDPRNSAEVPASAVLNAPAALRQLYATRVSNEADKLRGEWVYRMPARGLMNRTRMRRGRWW